MPDNINETVWPVGAGPMDEDYGVEVPFIRPSNLATDQAPTIPVISHAVDWFEQQGLVFEIVITIQPTSPFIDSKFINDAITKFVS